MMGKFISTKNCMPPGKPKRVHSRQNAASIWWANNTTALMKNSASSRRSVIDPSLARHKG